MKLLFKILSLRRSQEEGFVIPVVFALGLIMTLIGMITIFQSSDEDIISMSQRDTSRALAAAESGVARYREYIDKYKTIAIYSACVNGWNETTCNDSGAAATWANATAGVIPNLNTLCPATNRTVDDNDDDIQAIATRAWQNIGDDSSQGQYRLVDYIYTPGIYNPAGAKDNNPATPSYNRQPLGRLIVEGRIDQNNTNSANEPNASVSSISVDLPIQPGLPNIPATEIGVAPFLNGFNPALWITGATDAGGVTKVGNLRVNGNIVLTNDDCKFNSSAVLPTNANIFDNTKQSILLDTRKPSIATQTAPANINNITLADLTTKALPINGAKGTTIAGDTVYYYKLVDTIPPTPGSQTNLDLVGGNIINIRSGRKVVLYVEGNINITPNINIAAVPGPPAVPAVIGDININPDAQNNSSNLEIYVTDANKNINIDGNGNVNIKALIHAPSSVMNIAAGSQSNVTFVGAMWVKNWNSLAGANSFDINIDNADLAVAQNQYDQYLNYIYVKDQITANARVADPIIAPPSEWKTEETIQATP